MFSSDLRPLRRFLAWFRFRRFLVERRFKRFHHAWCYAIGSLSGDDAQDIMLDCREAAGWHPLIILTVEDTLEQALEIFENHPDLRRLIEEGCARVERKWESYGDELYEARRWAIEIAEGYAIDEDIALVRLDDEAALANSFDGDQQ
jgi:hypothetical protein